MWMTEPLCVAVCACTYQRPDGLKRLLAGVAAQTFDLLRSEPGDAPRLSVVIADNEGSVEVRRICETFAAETGIACIYVHEPRRGISFARNACLEHLPADCDVFAFIDDDEVPAPDWLDQLLLAQRRTGADVVHGRVVAHFEGEVPEWIAAGGFFAVPRRGHGVKLPQIADLAPLDRAATNNVLVRAEPVRAHKLRFAPAFALSGGSDTLFFRTLHALGCRTVHAAHAVVAEHVPVSRANLRYLMRVRFKTGNTAARIDAEMAKITPAGGGARVSEAVADIGLGLRRMVKSLLTGKWQKERFAIGALRIVYGAGYITAALGYRHQHYK
jgi:glycosyltransferase involved in cell wall biosynthesis